MVASIRKGFLLGVMLLALLAGLLGWTMKMEATSSLHYGSVQSSHTQTAMKIYPICPPPPFYCG